MLVDGKSVVPIIEEFLSQAEYRMKNGPMTCGDAEKLLKLRRSISAIDGLSVHAIGFLIMAIDDMVLEHKERTMCDCWTAAILVSRAA